MEHLPVSTPDTIGNSRPINRVRDSAKPATHGPTLTAVTLTADVVGRHCRSTFWLLSADGPTLLKNYDDDDDDDIDGRQSCGLQHLNNYSTITSRKWRHFRFCTNVVIIVIKQLFPTIHKKCTMTAAVLKKTYKLQREYKSNILKYTKM